MPRPVEYPKTRIQISANPWEETTEADYYDMLGVVFPAAQGGLAFAVGEALTHLLDEGVPVHDCYIEVAGRFFHRPEALDRFDPAAFEREVRAKFAI